MTMPASVKPPANANNASCGAARAADSPNPHAASVDAGCGGTTMSRNNGIPGAAKGHVTAATSMNVHPTTINWPVRSALATEVSTGQSLTGRPDDGPGMAETRASQSTKRKTPAHR